MVNSTPEQLVKEIYERLSSFRTASEQLAAHAETSKQTIGGWKTLTTKFTDAVQSTQKGMVEVVTSSSAVVDVAKAMQANVQVMIDQIQEIKLARRLETLEQDQKELLRHMLDLKTKHLERLESIDRIGKRLIAVVAGVLAVVVLIAMRLYGMV